MTVRQQIVEDRVEDLASLLQKDADHAFLRLAHHLITGQSVFMFDPEVLTEGSHDKQIDTITIDEEPDKATVYIIQSKNTDGFSSNALIQMRNGLHWLFNKSRSDINTLQNVRLKDKILEYRSIQSSVGPSNIRVWVRYAAKGHTAQLSQEFQQELKAIRDEFDNGTFAEFSCEPVGADELVHMMHIQEKRERRIDADLKIKYDANNPSLIQYYAEGLKGLVCSVPASEIARLVNSDIAGAIFDLNIRRFLGTRGAVNKDIQETCSNPNESYLFWFLNNGITIACDHLDAVTDPDNPHIKLKNMQIVNGCQTATTIAMAQNEGALARDVRVIVRIYQTADPALVDRIVLTTNNQNRISNRDLRANDQVQIDLEKGFSIYNYFYERKPRQFAGVELDPTRIFPNELVAQSYLAVVMKKPSDGRGRKYKVWGEFYDKIFGGQGVEPYILSTLIVRCVSEWLRSHGVTTAEDDIKRNVAKKGSFHLGRIAAFLWRGNDLWNIEQTILRNQLQSLESDSSILDDSVQNAFGILANIIAGDDRFLSDIDNALKSYTLDESIDRSLYTRIAGSS
jgi:hypothetical protein